jgi:2-keto-3-deoxy-L-rhamnonate aldolase RhmA
MNGFDPQNEKIVPGIHTAIPCYTQEMIQLGFQFVTVNSDIRLFVAEVPEVLESMGRAGLRQQKPC